MITQQFTDSPDDLNAAAALLAKGCVVAIPTETVYGLAADARNEEAISRIFAAKNRPADNPLIVHIAHRDQLYTVASHVPPLAEKLADAFWAGPLTMILPRSESIPDITTGGLDTVGVRMPANPIARKLITLSGCPLAAPSANRSGYPSPTTAAHVIADMNGRIAGIVDGGACQYGVESTVVVLEGDSVRILRPGAITAEMLATVADNVIIDDAVLEELPAGSVVRSPGTKYKHYSPRAKVTLVTGEIDAFRTYLDKYAEKGAYAIIYDESDLPVPVPYLCYGRKGNEQAHKLFALLRQCDEMKVNHVYVRAPQPTGMGLAVYNRLIRAAGFEIVTGEE